MVLALSLGHVADREQHGSVTQAVSVAKPTSTVVVWTELSIVGTVGDHVDGAVHPESGDQVGGEPTHGHDPIGPLEDGPRGGDAAGETVHRARSRCATAIHRDARPSDGGLP